ncbi:MAG: hypothetical protein SF052_18195 [Bacteroidia bacterium]|nr:hypothetical protein [Bacteroidia bacterium]
MRTLLLTIFTGVLLIPGLAQNGFGLRFASNINYFPRSQDYQLVSHAYTTGLMGFFYSSYKPRNGLELGFNIVHKGGAFNLPVVMRDFTTSGNVVEVTSVEMDLKVGPRFGAFNPKIGYIMGYRLRSSGFQEAGGEDRVNRFYLMLPFGVSVNLPTNYGSVGFGGYYNVGILNVLTDPNPGGGAIYDGGRLRYINLEIVVTYDFSGGAAE